MGYRWMKARSTHSCAASKARACSPAKGVSRTSAKRFYRLSQQGEVILTQLLLDWENLSQSLRAILQQSQTGPAPESSAPSTEAAPQD